MVFERKLKDLRHGIHFSLEYSHLTEFTLGGINECVVIITRLLQVPFLLELISDVGPKNQLYPFASHL